MNKFYIEFYDLFFEIHAEKALFERSFLGLIKECYSQTPDYIINFCGIIEKTKLIPFCTGTKVANFMGNYYYSHRISATETILIHLDDSNGSHMLHCLGNKINIYSIDKYCDCIWAVRICQEIILTEMLRKGFVPVHASAVEYMNTGVLIFGHKRDGKSTTMLSLVEEGCNVMANDLVFLGKDSSGCWIVVGWPWKLTIGNTLLSKTKYNDYITRNSINDKTAFYPSEFCTIFNCHWSWNTRLNLIIHPQIKIGKPIHIATITKDNAKNMLINMGIEYPTINCIFTTEKLIPDYETVFADLANNFSIINITGDIWENKAAIKEIVEKDKV